MTIQPEITKAQRNELRTRAAKHRRWGDSAMVNVRAHHLLDLLDAADREAEMVEGIRDFHDNPNGENRYTKLRALLGRDG